MADLEPGVALSPSTIAAMERLSTSPRTAMTDQYKATTYEQWERQYLRDRLAALEATQQKIRSGPESPLVERVADAIAAQATSAGIVNDRPARAAIIEVASAILDWWDSDEVARTGWEAAKWLEQEANR
jgi:hypothetical protein